MESKRIMNVLLCWVLLLGAFMPWGATIATASGDPPMKIIFEDDFEGATTDTLFTTSYKSLPNDPSKPMYVRNNDSIAIEDGQLKLSAGARLSIGALSAEETESTRTPGGVLDLSKPYKILIDVSGVGGNMDKAFQVYVDNNTTSASNSIHSNRSRIYNTKANTINEGVIEIDSAVGNNNSFITLRVESGLTLMIQSITILTEDGGVEPEDPEQPEEPEEPEDPDDPEEPEEPEEPEDPEEPGQPGDPGGTGEPIFFDEFEGVTDIFSASYRSLPGQPTTPMYRRGGGLITANPATETITMNEGRMTIGAKGTSSTSSSSTPGGIFDLSKPYQIIINIVSIQGDDGKKLQVYVDNNTTTQANSPHGNASRIYNENANSIPEGKLIIPSSVGTKESFIQIRTESGASATIESIAIIYDGDPDPTIPVAPAVPTGLTALAGDEQVTLSWDSARKVDGYTVRYWSDADPDKTEVAVSSNTLKLTELMNGVTYYFTVEAHNVAGKSGETAPLSVTPMQGSPPETPTGLVSTPGDALISLRWDATMNAEGYRVYQWNAETESYEFITETDQNIFTVTGLDNGTTYYFVIEAYNKRGTSPRTDQVSATPDAALSHKPLGFASLGNDGKGTTGGEGGAEVTVTSSTEFADIMKARERKSTEPLIVYIDGTLTGRDMLDVKDTANISIIGVGNHAKFSGLGLKVVRSNNIIIQNITFENASDDSIEVTQSHNIWIHHNTFSNGYDGLLDVKEGSTNVTIAWNHFKDHRKTSLVGHTDKNGSTDKNLKVTYHHNFFDGTYSRNPRVRFGQVHVVNNYYLNTGSAFDGGGYGVGAAANSQIVAEGNYFENVKMPIIVGWPDWSGSPIANYPGYVGHRNNIYDNSGEPHTNDSGLTFNPTDYYLFPVDDPENVPELVLKYAGAGERIVSPPGGDPDDKDPPKDPGDPGEPGDKDPPTEPGDPDEPGDKDPPTEPGDPDEPGDKDPSTDPDDSGNKTPPSGSTGGSSTTPTTPKDDEAVKADEQGIAITPEKEVTEKNGKTIATFTVSVSNLSKALEELAENEVAQRRILIEAEADDQAATEIVLPMAVLLEAAQSESDALLSMKVGNVRYDLPISALDLESVVNGAIDAEKAVITVSISPVQGQLADQLVAEARASGLKIVADVVEFSIRISDGSMSMEWNDFDAYIIRTIEFAANVIEFDRLTAVWYDELKGEWVFVPAFFHIVDERVEAIIKRTSNSTYTIVEHQATFTDVTQHWAKAEIELLASKLVVKGMDENQYMPDQLITRAEFASLLVRALGLKEQRTDSFTDVELSDWYAGAVATAAESGLVNGVSDSQFDPHANITREQMAVMLSRALQLAGEDTETSLTSLSKFGDRNEISSWAEAEVSQAMAAGIINGKSANLFAPQDYATRAEAAVMLKRFLQYVEFMN